MNEVFDENNTQIQTAMVMKLQQLQRCYVPNLSYQNLEDYLVHCVWRDHYPRSLHEGVNDILSLTANQIILYLTKQAIVDGYNEDLSSFSDLLGGK